MIENPVRAHKEQDYFIIGSAVDYWLEKGEKKFWKKYMLVTQRFDPASRMEALADKIQKQLETISKSRTQGGTPLQQADLMSYQAELKKLETGDADKIQITPSNLRTIQNCVNEAGANKIFNHKPKKKVFENDFFGVKMRAEVDDFDEKQRLINDVKSCANINKFDPTDYVWQLSFYELMASIHYGELEGDDGDWQCRVSVVDKYGPFSRSLVFDYPKTFIREERRKIIEALEKYKLALKTGIFRPASEMSVLLNCPYYGVDNHGRHPVPLIA